MTDPLPPLGLDDLRVAEPDRDSESVFDAAETWALACAKVGNGYPAEDVAAVLLELDDDELAELHDELPEQVDANGSALALCRALAVLHSDHWTPHISRASVFDLLDERDRLRAQISAIPEDAIGLVAKYAAAFFAQSQDDDGVSPEEQAERDEGADALDLVNAWFVRP